MWRLSKARRISIHHSENMNSATRVKAIVSHFCALKHDSQQIEGWKTYLNIQPGATQAQIEEAVIIALRALGAELRNLEAKARYLDVPEDCYKGVVAGLYKSLSTKYVHLPWSQSQGGVVPPEVRMCLSWMSWALSNYSEEQMSQDDMVDLLTAISEQEELLINTKIPMGLRELLESQLNELKTALILYQINGAKPIVDAVNKQCGEMRNAAPDLVKEVEGSSEEVKSVLAKGMELISKAAKAAENGSKIFKFGQEVYQLGSAGWQTFGKGLLTSGG